MLPITQSFESLGQVLLNSSANYNTGTEEMIREPLLFYVRLLMAMEVNSVVLLVGLNLYPLVWLIKQKAILSKYI